jgi:diguanylate cyclase (GGDEF)-like protein
MPIAADQALASNARPLDAAVVTAMRGVFAHQLASVTRLDGSIDRQALSNLVTDFYARAVADSQAQAARFRVVLENVVQGLCFFDGAGRLIICNRRYAEIYDLEPDHVQPGTTLQDIVDQRFLAGSIPAMSTTDYLRWRNEVTATNLPHDSVIDLQNGRTIAIRHQPMPDGGWIATHEDITERLATERKLSHLARHDAVTGLPNRTLLAEQLAQVLSRTSMAAPCALLSLCINEFRSVNDTLGRGVGDELLRAVTDRLRQRLHPADLLGHPSANEFVMVQFDAAQPRGAIRLAEQVLEAIARPLVLDGHHLTVSASIGIATGFVAGLDAHNLMKDSRIALYRAETEGRGRYRLFEPEMDAVIQERRALEIDLRGAVESMAFELYYQPQIDMLTGRVSGLEALLRWNHPRRGAVSPDSFIPLAEELGLIDRIGEWVIGQACIDAASWPEAVSIAVNVSALQIKDNSLPRIVAEALRRSGLTPGRLELEITETSMVESAAAASATLRQLQAYGIRIAIDDFGTGYSSLSYLPNLPVNKIKIDRSFVCKLGQGPAHTYIIRAIISLSASLGVSCTAEGVETAEQLAILAHENCPQVQGYLLGMPCPARDVAGVLQTAELTARAPLAAGFPSA